MHDPLMLAQIRSAVGLVDFVSKTVELKPQGDDFFGLCPFHQETTPSFSITPEKGLFYCHGCGASGDIFSFVRQKHKVGFSDAVKILAIEAGIEPDPAPQSAEYIYLNADSQNHLRVKRYYKNGKKCFAQSHWDGSRWVSGSKGIDRILYRLPEVLSSDFVLIVEGEKDCHTARDFGLEAQLGAIATTSPGGAEKWVLGAGERWLKGRRVVIIPDCDAAGDRHCRQVLGDVPMAKVLKLPQGKDLTEYLCGRGTIEELSRLIEGVLSGSDRNGLEQGTWMSDRNGHEGSGKDDSIYSPPSINSDHQSLEAEFETIKTKYQQALERVEQLTKEWEEANPENKKEAAQKLKNAQNILSSLNSTRHVTSNQISRQSKKIKGEAETGFAKDFIVVQEKVSERLSYNILEKSIYFDNERTEFNSACLWLSEKTGHINWNKGDSTLSLLILDFAKKKQFCPVQQYLELIEQKVHHSYIDQCVPFLFGIKPETDAYVLAVAAFKAQLVGSVRRIYEPGCHHRLMPILHGQQKRGKSTFLRNLYNGFSKAGHLPLSDKDSAMIIQRVWAFEIDECDKLFRTREASTLKSFVSLTEDFFRAPYERDTLGHKRRSVLWGTTNHYALFSDPTGNTRYPVISMPDGWAIDTTWVKENRDNIWAAALDAYHAGISNEIPAELEEAIAQDSENYMDRDALFEPVEEFLATKMTGDSIALIDIGKHLGFENSKFSKMDQNRITAIMRALGWQSRNIRYLGKQQKRWISQETADKIYGS